MQVTDNLNQAKIYSDFTGLANLRQSAKANEDGATREVAEQLEGVFLQMVLKSMRDANKAFSEKSLFNSQQSQFYQDMFDQQLSLHLSGSKGLGLADVLVEQMKQYTTDKQEAMSEIVEASTEANDSIGELDNMAQTIHSLMKVNQNSKNEKLDTTKENSELVEKIEETITKFASPQEFLQALYPIAKSVAEKFGLSGKMILAQSALETGWGKHIMQHSNGQSSFNLFGIKADKRWQGNAVDSLTTEYREGIKGKERADFRSYDSFEQSFHDYAKFLQDNPRYQSALKVADNPEQFIEAIHQAGYATDPNYATKVKRIYHDKIIQQLKQLGL